MSFKSDTKAPEHLFKIEPPFQGSPQNPRSVGATGVVYDSVAIGGELVIVGLPAAGWTATGPNAYKYKGASTDPITRAVLKPNQISFKGGKDAWAYTLDEPSQGRVAAAMFIGNTFWCADAPAKASGNPPSTAKNDRVDKFVAAPNTPAPPFCVSP